MSEIPDSPLSRHDLEVIRLALRLARTTGHTPEEIIVSSQRVRVGSFRAFGLPVRLNDDLGLNDGLIVCEGREPVEFDFEVSHD